MPRYRFGEVSVDTDSVEITGPDGVREIEPQAFDVLCYLIEQSGRLVTKEELLDNVWGDRFVSESSLTTRIKQARRAVGDDGRTQWAIKTVHGRGYRFVAPDEAGDSVDESDLTRQAAEPTPNRLPDELQADTRAMFVGRTAELEEADRILGRPADQRFGWVWILGEPGIGKTRLAAEVARHAQRRGHHVLFGRNNEDLRVPYQPFIEVIRSAIDQAGPERRADVVDQLPPELAPLLPGMLASAARSGTLERGGTATDTESRRYRLFEALSSWLVEQASAAPLTVILDDVHWAADSTLQLLTHFQQRPDGAAITFVLTARDTAPDANPQVLDLLASGLGVPHSTVLRLAGLSSDEAFRVVGHSVALGEVMRQTAGNPLLLQAVNPADGSVDVESAVHRRLASLDTSVQETLQDVSILGLEFELQIAAVATRRDELDVLDDLEQAIAARLIDDVGVDRFRFTHALVRSSLRDDLSSARRARMHRRTAEAIVKVFAGERRYLPALAYHTAAAVEAEPALRPLAVERLVLAAREEMSQLSFDEAAASLRRALELTDPSDTKWRAQLTLEMGIAETRAGASMTAAHTFERAVVAARASGDPLLRVEAALRYEDATWRPGLSGVNALEHLEEAADVLDEAVRAGQAINDEAELRARLAIGRLRALALAGRTVEADDEFEAAHELARTVGSATLEATVLNVYLSQVLYFRGLEGTHHLVRRLAELQPSIDDGDAALHAAHVRHLHAFQSGDYSRLHEIDGLIKDLQERSHSSFWTFNRTNQEAMNAFYRGDLAGAEELAERCLALASDLPEEDGSGIYGLRMFMIRREQDRLSSIAPLVRHVLATGDITGVWTPGLALLLIETGARDEAADVVREIKAASFELPIDSMWSTVMAFLIETMVHLGDREACEILRAQFGRLAGTNVTTGSGLLSFGAADRFLGMLSLTVGDVDAAEEHLGSALDIDSRGGSVLWLNESRLWMSRVRRLQGHEAEADAILAVVAHEARAAGLPRLLRLASSEQP